MVRKPKDEQTTPKLGDRPRPGFWMNLYSFLVAPFAREGSLVWWWRQHQNVHTVYVDVRGRPIYFVPSCPYCKEADREAS